MSVTGQWFSFEREKSFWEQNLLIVFPLWFHAKTWSWCNDRFQFPIDKISLPILEGYIKITYKSINLEKYIKFANQSMISEGYIKITYKSINLEEYIKFANQSMISEGYIQIIRNTNKPSEKQIFPCFFQILTLDFVPRHQHYK